MSSPSIDTLIDKALKEQAKVCAEVEKSLKVNGVAAIEKLLNATRKNTTLLRQ
jgi:hypothetical protein